MNLVIKCFPPMILAHVILNKIVEIYWVQKTKEKFDIWDLHSGLTHQIRKRKGYIPLGY